MEQVKNINNENERLSALYGGNYAFVKTYQDCIEQYATIDKSEMEQILQFVYESIHDVLDKDIVLIQGRKNFIASVKKKVTRQLLREKLYKKVKSYYEAILNELYNNIQLFK